MRASQTLDLPERIKTALRRLTLVYDTARYPDAASPFLQAIAYFKVPIIGSGTDRDPYRAKMPEGLEENPKWGRINKFALTYSALIPTDDKGKPIHDFALVIIFEQSGRQEHLAPVETCQGL